MERECRHRKSQESVRVECGVWASAASKVWGKVWGFGWIWERRRRCVGPSKVNILWRYSWWKTLIRYRYQYTLTRIYVLKITVLPCLIWFTFCNGQIWNSTFHNTNLSKITISHFHYFFTMMKNRKHCSRRHYDRILVQYSDCIQNRTIAVGIQSWHNYCRNTVRNFLCRRNTVAIQSHCVRVWGLGYEISLFLCPYEILVTSMNYCSRNTVGSHQ